LLIISYVDFTSFFLRLENRSPSGSNSSATFLGEDSSLQASTAAKPEEGREKKMEEQEAEDLPEEGREEVEVGKEEEGSSFSSGESSHSTVSGSSIINWNFTDFRS
jgi:hypothetical protein